MKLAFVALVLAAVAFAAPLTEFIENDNLVPETLVEVGADNTIAALKLQFHELEVQLKSGVQVTPKVKETIDKMIDMVTNEIEPAINTAHNDDQEILNTDMRAIGELNDSLNNEVDIINKEADLVRDLIDEQQRHAQLWDEAAALFTQTQDKYLHKYDDTKDTCCQRQNSAVLDVQYVPAFVTCDYTVPAGTQCSKRAREAVSNIVTTPFTDGLALYSKLVGKCSVLEGELKAADEDTDDKHEDCRQKKINEQSAYKIAKEQQAAVQQRWDTTISQYNGNYTAAMHAYQNAKRQVQKQEADRKNEWQATQEIKCLLEAYKEGGGFTEGAQAGCVNKIAVKLDIGYPTEHAQLTPVLAPFEDYTDVSSYRNTCNERTPAPVYICIVREPRPYPTCDPHHIKTPEDEEMGIFN